MEKIYIYKTTNKINGKIYIGQHKYESLLKDDGYLGSGKKGIPLSEECKRKKSEAMKGKHWKLVDGKRVWF